MFTLICHKCGNKIELDNGTELKYSFQDNFEIEVGYTVFETIKITCKCGNEIETA